MPALSFTCSPTAIANWCAELPVELSSVDSGELSHAAELPKPGKFSQFNQLSSSTVMLPKSPHSSTSMLANLSDVDLYRVLKQGEKKALSIIYDRYVNLVYGLSLRILCSAQEAEDLTQEIFLNLWQRDLYNPNRGSLGSFLITLTRSRAIDRLRSRQSQSRSVQRMGILLDLHDGAASPMETATLSERSQRLREALTQLPEAERQVLEIAYFEGLSQSEIAQRLNIPLGTIKTRCRQGLLKLRQSLTDLELK